MKHKFETLVAVGTALVLFSLSLALGPALKPQAQGCAPPCHESEQCKVSPGGGMECSTTCQCPPGETPPAEEETTPVPWTPAPTATPLPSFMDAVCWADGCGTGESRLTYFQYDAMGTMVGAFYLEGCCGPSCPCEEPTTDDEPVTVPGNYVQGSEWGATVQLQLPVWTADRRPYPRGMVRVPNNIWAEDIPSANAWSNTVNPGGSDCACRATGTCEDDSPPRGTMCEFQLGLKTEPGAEAPTWACEESEGGYGYQTVCTWKYSSADKPYIGKGLSCEDLPAFEVTASLPYWWSIGRRWYEWEKIGQDCECNCKVCEDPNGCSDQCGGQAGLCTGANEFWDRDCEDIYGWVHHGPNWELLDLRDYGHPTPFMRNGKVRLVSSRSCGPHPVGRLPIPVIEVQGVISNPKD